MLGPPNSSKDVLSFTNVRSDGSVYYNYRLNGAHGAVVTVSAGSLHPIHPTGPTPTGDLLTRSRVRGHAAYELTVGRAGHFFYWHEEGRSWTAMFVSTSSASALHQLATLVPYAAA